MGKKKSEVPDPTPVEVTAPHVIDQDIAAVAHASPDAAVELPIEEPEAHMPEDALSERIATSSDIAALARGAESPEGAGDPPDMLAPQRRAIAPAPEATEAPAPEAPAAEAPSEPVATTFDPVCKEQRRHRAQCNCTGDARAPIAA